jgi:hypothetical protein
MPKYTKKYIRNRTLKTAVHEAGHAFMTLRLGGILHYIHMKQLSGAVYRGTPSGEKGDAMRLVIAVSGVMAEIAYTRKRRGDSYPIDPEAKEKLLKFCLDKFKTVSDYVFDFVNATEGLQDKSPEQQDKAIMNAMAASYQRIENGWRWYRRLYLFLKKNPNRKIKASEALQAMDVEMYVMKTKRKVPVSRMDYWMRRRAGENGYFWKLHRNSVPNDLKFPAPAKTPRQTQP